MKALIVAGVALGLCACTPRGTGEAFMSQEEMDAKDNAACASFGAAPGTQVYVDCRLRLRSNRSAEDSSRKLRAML